ncbi:MAG: IPT/TIG domain-containing protein [Planctomycetes bacterium]|nr:IPT/TIG domain-containing protein [Planctomycetota bacterium]
MSHRASVPPLVVGLFLVALFAWACGGGGGGSSSLSPASGGSTGAVAGLAYGGPVGAGAVKVYRLAANGQRETTEIGKATTSADGLFDINIEQSKLTMALLIEVSSGSYLEEAGNLKDPVLVEASNPLRLVLPSGLASYRGLACTPITTIAANYVLSKTPSATLPLDLLITNANRMVGDLFGVEAIATNQPRDVTKAIANIDVNDAQVKNGFVLAGISQEAKAKNATSMHMAAAWSADLSADGRLDGLGTGGTAVAIGTSGATLSATSARADLAAAIDQFASGVNNRSGASGTDTNALETAVSGLPVAAPSPPQPTGVTPTTGDADGGTSFTISGSNFEAGSTVKVGGVAATGATVNTAATPQTITFTGPKAGAGTHTVTVTNPTSGLQAQLTAAVTLALSNGPPTAVVKTPGTTVSGDAAIIKYTLSDPNSDPCGITPEYSIDDAKTWLACTDGAGGDGRVNLVTSPTGRDHEYSWKSSADIRNTFVTNARLRVTPSDGRTGTPTATPSDPFVVNNSPSLSNSPPVAVAETPQGEQTGDRVSLIYSLTDKDGDLANVRVEFSTQGGAQATFSQCTAGWGGEGATQLIAQATAVPHLFVWNSAVDIQRKRETNVKFRVIPTDGNTGVLGTTGESAVFVVDNTQVPVPNTPPTVTEITCPAAKVAGDYLVSYKISDPESNTASVEVYYSVDGGSSFARATVKAGAGDGETNLATSAGGTAHTWNWDSAKDVAGLSSTVALRIIPFDAPSGTNVQGFAKISCTFTVENGTTPVVPPSPGTTGDTGGAIAGTDIWYVDFTFDNDNNGQADFDEAVLQAGFTQADITACKNKTLEYVRTWYRNDPAGATADAVKVSFTGTKPTAGKSPSAGASTLNFTKGDYNRMVMSKVPDQGGAVGRAFFDSTSNPKEECNCGASPYMGGDQLGCFANLFADFFRGSPNLPRTPDEFGRHISSVLGHEIGHSLGLQHYSQNTPNPQKERYIMHAAGLINIPGLKYIFDDGSWNQLQQNMPGPGR